MSDPDSGAGSIVTKYENRKQAIVHAAVDVMSRKGVKGMTLGEVAAALDLVPSAVGYYFRKKEDLAAACFLDSIRWFDTFVDSAMSEPTPEARLRRFILEVMDHWVRAQRGEAPPIVQFNDIRTIDNTEVNEAYANIYRRLRRLMDREGAERLPRMHRNARAHLVLTQVLWIILWAPRYDLRDLRRAAERLADILINGLAAKGQAWTDAWLAPPVDESAAAGELSPGAFLKAATELINDQGYRGASVVKIAARLNVTKGAFYHHHDAKDDVVEACFARTLSILRQVQDATEARGGGRLEQLSEATGTLFRHHVSGDVPILRISAIAALSGPIQERIVREYEQVARHFSGLVSDGIADGSIRPVDADVAGLMITAMISGATELQNWSAEVTPETAARSFAKPLIEGIFSPSE